MALNVTYFNRLCLFDKLDLIRQQGKYLTTVKESKNIINLHLVDDVFVEVYYHENYTNVRFLKLIKPTEKRFELYSDKINLEDRSTAEA